VRHVRGLSSVGQGQGQGPPRLSQTKVVCTLGPSSETMELVADLVGEGLNVARLNFSHVPAGSYDEPQAKLDLVRAAPGVHSLLDAGVPESERRPPNLRAVMLDTKGPEIRTKPLLAEVMDIVEGDDIILTSGTDVTATPATGGDPSCTSTEKKMLGTDYDQLASTVKEGSQVLLDDGLIALEVVSVDLATGFVRTTALNAGPIKKNKGVNLPGATLQLPALTEKDRADLRWGVEAGVDAVAASFIRKAADVRAVIAHLERCCGEAGRSTRPIVVSKIESQEGVANFDDILEASDGIMIARGDLGVEIPFEQVFKHQKDMVRACNDAGKPVIVATQMLDSMQKNPRPTRAEVTDVGQAVIDGTDAVMLSGETAAGKYPLAAVKAMQSIAREADSIVDADLDDAFGAPRPRVSTLRDGKKTLWDPSLDAITSAAVETAAALGAKLIIAITSTGEVARSLAKMRPNVPVVALCTDEHVARQLQFHRSLNPILIPTATASFAGPDAFAAEKMTELRAEALRTVTELGWIKSKDKVLIVDRKAGASTANSKYMNRVNLLVITAI